jgi:hypothetical protein
MPAYMNKLLFKVGTMLFYAQTPSIEGLTQKGPTLTGIETG